MISSYHEFVKMMMPKLDGTPQQRMKKISQMWKTQKGQGQQQNITPKLRGGSIPKRKPPMRIKKPKDIDEDILNNIFKVEFNKKRIANSEDNLQPKNSKVVQLNNGKLIDLEDIDHIMGMYKKGDEQTANQSGGRLSEGFRRRRHARVKRRQHKSYQFFAKIGDTLKDPKTWLSVATTVLPMLL